MKRKLPLLKTPIIITLVIVLAIVAFSFLLNFGILKSNIEADARKTMAIDSQWIAVQDSGEEISALLFYAEKSSGYTSAIYVKENFLPGYEFKSGGRTALEMKGVVKQTGDYLDEAAYLSMNTQQISRAEIDNGTSVEKIEISKDSPFVIISPNKKWLVSFFDDSGNESKIFEENIYPSP